MLTCRIFLEIAQIQIHQLIIFIVFFPKQIRRFSFPVVKQLNSLVYNIKYTYLLAFCLPVWTDFPKTLYVQCWTGANGSSLTAPSVLQIQFLCDKTRYYISEVINFLVTFSLHRFSWLILMHHFIPSKLVNIHLPTPTKRGTNSNLFNSRYFKANVFRFIRTFLL